MRGHVEVGYTVTVFLLVISLQTHLGGSIDISLNADGGYTNVTVAIGSQLDEGQCANIVNNIKSMIESGSDLLHSATGRKVFFSEVTILLPSNWTSCGEETIEPSASLRFEDAHIRIQSSHPLFGNNPWTQQPRGCGEQGDYIYFSDSFLDQATPTLGSQASVFVHEWSKFRWGVFEEYGHPGDSIFPSAYKTSESDWQANYCADTTVKGELNSGTCGPNNDESECIFTPDINQSTNVSSSLLGVPFLQSVNTFCTSDTHSTTVPTKQNLMCDKKSTWEIISQHDDIKADGFTATKLNTTFTIQNSEDSPSSDTILFLLDCTKVMKEVFLRWTYLEDVIRQFIIVKAPVGSVVGFQLFDDSPLSDPVFETLNNRINRDSLVQQLLDQSEKAKFDSSTKNIAVALQSASKALETNGYKGKIILITENLKEHSETAADIVVSAMGYPVQPLLYPADPDIATSIYEPVARVANLFVQKIDNEYLDEGKTTQSEENLIQLTQLIQNIGSTDFTVISSQSVSVADIPTRGNLTLLVENSTNYERDFFVEVLLLQYTPKTTNIIVENPSQVQLEITSEGYSSVIFTSPDMELLDNVYTVYLSGLGFIQGKVYAYIVGIAKSSVNPYTVTVSTSKPLNDLAFTSDPPTAPIIYATLTDGIHAIVKAEVTAMITNVLSGGQLKSINLTLLDNGVGGDVTGNDGTYSSYLIGIEEAGTLSISISASDNNGSANIVRGSLIANSAPVDPSATIPACCGSSLIIPSDLLENARSFSVGSTPGTRGIASGSFPGLNSYPPGRITDLKGVRTGNEVNLTFTATGEDFNIGQAASYRLKNGIDMEFFQDYNISVDAGTVVSVIAPVTCGVQNTFTIEAYDILGNPSDPSNEVRIIYSCVTDNSTLSAGAIVGIVIACIVVVAIIIIIICACMNRDGDKMLSCDCWKKIKSKEKRSHLVAPRTGRDAGMDVIRSKPAPREISNAGHIRPTSVPSPIHTVDDLYRKPYQKRQIDSDSDGGFKELRLQGRNAGMNGIRDSSSEASSISTYNPRPLPGNDIGIPVSTRTSEYGSRTEPVFQTQRPSQGYSNQAYYNDSENRAHSISHSISNQANVNKKPILPPITRRNNTQV